MASYLLILMGNSIFTCKDSSLELNYKNTHRVFGLTLQMLL